MRHTLTILLTLLTTAALCGPAESTVYIADTTGCHTASGFCIAPDTVLTANHVAKMGRGLLVRDTHGRWLRATVIKSGRPDWAMLRVAGLKADPMPLGTCRQGDTVTAYGRFAEGMRCNGAGVVKDWPFQMDMQYCTTRVYPGFSGGPVVNDRGEAVGIVSMETPGGECLMVPVGRVNAR